MKPADRLMTFFAAVALSALSLMAMSRYVGSVIAAAGDWLYRNLMYTWYTTFLLQLAIVMLVAYLLEMTFRTGKPTGRLLKRATETGDIYVSMGTIESFARNLAKEIDGVQDVDLVAKSGPEGLDFTLKVSASKDAILPELTSKLESRIREALPAQSGFPVRSVKTLVRSAS